MAKADKSLIASEAKTDMLKSLEDARLNGVYDNRYAYEMKYQLDLTLAQLNQVARQTNSASLKDFSNNTAANLTPIRQQFIDYVQSSAID